MNPVNALAAAHQVVSNAKAQPLSNQPMPGMNQGMNPQPGLPTPPPQIALALAKQAKKLPPMVLGTLLWRALQQHGVATGNLTQHFGGQAPMGQPQMNQMGGAQNG